MAKTKTKTKLLIDGDVLVYKIGLAAERPTDWGDDFWTLHADLGECKSTVRSTIERWMDLLGASEYQLALSCPLTENFRIGLCPTYKSNRKKARKPVVYAPLRQFLLDEFGALRWDQLEADDILGILSTEPSREKRILVSEDKDYLGIPGLFYRTCEETPTVVEVTSEEAARFHAKQSLMGDRTDGYIGVPGCGPKTADKLIDWAPAKNLWKVVKQAYADAGLTEKDALTTARLARILQFKDYNQKTGKITLWKP